MGTAADILANAADLTRRYSKAVTTEAVPARVYVLLQNGIVLGVLSTEQWAVDEAHSLMHVSGGIWQEQIIGRYWRQGTVSMEVSPHDVR